MTDTTYKVVNVKPIVGKLIRYKGDHSWVGLCTGISPITKSDSMNGRGLEEGGYVRIDGNTTGITYDRWETVEEVKAETKKDKRVKKIKGGNDGFTVRQFFIDDDNYVQIKSNNKLIKITLKLKGDKPRFIGTVTKSTRTIEIRRKEHIHLFRKFNAYGFNNYVLTELFHGSNSLSWIRLSDDLGNHWKIPVKYVVENGKYLHFKQQNFEKQRFVSLDEIEQFRVKVEENRRITL